MPSWITHFVVANEVVKRINIENKNEFIFANIMPDILEGYNVKNVSTLVKDYATHFPKLTDISGISIPIPDIKKFKQEYKNKFDNIIISGYFSHLLTDYFWNMYTYEKYFESYDKERDLVKIRLNNHKYKILTWDEAVKIKQEDFKKFTQYLNNNMRFFTPFYEEMIYKDSKEIQEFNYTKEDIKNTIKYINNIKQLQENSNKEKQYEIFTIQELLEKLDENIEFVLKNII